MVAGYRTVDMSVISVECLLYNNMSETPYKN